MSTVCPHTSLSPALRHALRVFALWIDDGGNRRSRAFTARASIRPLDQTDRARLVRWLAWTMHARASQGHPDLTSRLRRLDTRLHSDVSRAGQRLPAAAATLAVERLREA